MTERPGKLAVRKTCRRVLRVEPGEGAVQFYQVASRHGYLKLSVEDNVGGA